MFCFDTELPVWLAFSLYPGVGPRFFARVLSLGRLLSELVNDTGVNLSPVITSQLPWKQVDAILQWAEQESCTILTWRHPEYPRLLTEIADSPPVLYVQGDVSTLAQAQIAMIGTRRPTLNSEKTAFIWAKALSEMGFVITSGLALGIDGASHRGALAHQGSRTVAVLGSGLAHIYPRAHVALARSIRERGALVSEFPPEMTPKACNFPRRNRIISGLSRGVVVIEASERSGSLITARLANEQGREVFAVPGSIYNTSAKGCHRLIRQGAMLVESVADILQELAPSQLKWVEQNQREAVDNESKNEQSGVLSLIDYTVTPLEALLKRSGLTTMELSSMLLQLELQGQVCRVAGGYQRLIRDVQKTTR